MKCALLVVGPRPVSLTVGEKRLGVGVVCVLGYTYTTRKYSRYRQDCCFCDSRLFFDGYIQCGTPP